MRKSSSLFRHSFVVLLLLAWEKSFTARYSYERQAVSTSSALSSAPVGRTRRGSIFVSALASESQGNSTTPDYLLRDEDPQKPSVKQRRLSSQSPEVEHLLPQSEKPLESNHTVPDNVTNDVPNRVQSEGTVGVSKPPLIGSQEKNKVASSTAVRFQMPCTVPACPNNTTAILSCQEELVEIKAPTRPNVSQPGISVSAVYHKPLWALSDEPGNNVHIASIPASPFQVPANWLNSHRYSSPASCTKVSCYVNHEAAFSTPSQMQPYLSHGHQSHPTFFLPCTPTDTNVTSSTGALGDVVMRTVKTFPLRRGSTIVRSGRTTNITAVPGLGSTADQSGSAGSPVEGFIVTPFAQVLVSMQRIRNAFVRLTSAQSSHRFAVASPTVPEPITSEQLTPESTDYKTIANETLDELEWCLKQLENIQTKRPVSDMAFSKFKRLLNKELNSFTESDKSRHEISAYICGTFLEDEKDAEVNQEIEQMLERRRSSGQSHSSAGNQEQPLGSSTPKQRHPVLSDIGTTISPKISDSSNTPIGKVEQSMVTHQDRKPSEVSSESNRVDGRKASEIAELDKKEARMPVNGIITPNDKELDERFTQTLDTWGADIFEIDRLSNGHALTTTAYRIFQKRDLMHIFSIDAATLVRYLLKVESNYHSDVPYHNSLHAADVTQTSHFLLQAETLEDVFSDLEILAVIFASVVHDVDHPGLTNQFLVNSGHDLALQYNDASVLENHHLYVAFKLLNEPDCDVFAQLSAKKRQTLRRMVIELVLATDMSKHMSLLADLRTMVEAKKVSGSGVLNLDNYSDRLQILQNMIHCADLSNPAKPLRLNRKWTGRLMEEFFRQGDTERKMKLEISPMCDRESVAIEKSQVSFIDFVAHPLLESWCDLVHPSAQVILDILADNRDWYESQAEGQKTSGASKGRPKLATAEEDEEEAAAS